MSESRIPVKFIIEGLGEAKGELMKFLSPKTVESILKVLPVEGYAAVWKEEVYFNIPVSVGAEKPKSRVETGDLAYWPMGSAICIFYGKSQPYSSVNIIGKITENLEVFKQVKEGVKITLTRC
ncbi:hypothetical protein KEJ50_00810 [Candidatus Bathyarchaeota archaeon]|nr:hypothetical protein [Candidatus Bathyarchaeota archaeon]